MIFTDKPNDKSPTNGDMNELIGAADSERLTSSAAPLVTTMWSNAKIKFSAFDPEIKK